MAGTEDILEQYGTDPDLESEGVWSSDFRAGIEMKIRSSQAKEVKAAQERVNKRCERFWKIKEEVPEHIQKKNQADLASAIVADWRQRTTTAAKDGTETDVVTATIQYAGQAVAATDENKKAVFSDARLWSLTMSVIAQMNEIDRFRRSEVEADVGNSPAPSGPLSSSVAPASA